MMQPSQSWVRAGAWSSITLRVALWSVPEPKTQMCAHGKGAGSGDHGDPRPETPDLRPWVNGLTLGLDPGAWS